MTSWITSQPGILYEYVTTCIRPICMIGCNNECNAKSKTFANTLQTFASFWSISFLLFYQWLHWLPVNHLISYKLKSADVESTAHCSSILPFWVNVPARTLRSSNTCLLAIPTGVTSHFSSHSFSASAPLTWNSLPVHIRSIENLSTFKRQLKSHFFQSAFTV